MLFSTASQHIEHAFEAIGAALTKEAGDAVRTDGLVGRLYLSESGWLLLAVPNAIGNGAFAALDELGIEQPKKNGVYSAHISVMRPAEIEQIGGPDKISERGKTFHYHLGVVKTVEPKTWEGVSKVWYLTVYSPELKALRASYGLSPLPNVDWDFHCTIAVRKTGVLRANDISKAAMTWKPCPDCGGGMTSKSPQGDTYRGSLRCLDCGKLMAATGWAKEVEEEAEKDDPREYCANCNTRFERGDDGFCNRCGKDFDKKAADVSLVAALRQARKDTNTEPTEAQQEAGNYAKGKLRMHGLPISIENPKGSTRSGTDPNGKQWSVTMKHDYGYIRGTTDNDEDHVDVFIGPDLDSEFAVIVDQVHPDSGEFDEHKVLLGFTNEADAIDAYKANYDKDWKGFGRATCLTVEHLRWWLDNGDQTKPIENGMFAKHRRKSAEEELTASMQEQVFYDPICPHCNEVMHEKHFVPDRDKRSHFRHRGDCYDKGSFKIVWPSKEAADHDYWTSPPNKEGRKCEGCGSLFKECEPLPGVDMCEVCERFGPSKKKAEACDVICPHCQQDMIDLEYWPDGDAWRHRGACWEKGAFIIPWETPQQEVCGFFKAAFDLSTIPNAITKAPGQIAGYWNSMKPEAQGEAVTLLGSLGLGAGMGALTGAISAEPNYRAEAAKRDAFRGLLSGLAGYTAMKGTQHLFNDSGKPPVESAITGLGGLALSKALYGAGYPLERAIFGRPSWDVLPEDLAALKEDLQDRKDDEAATKVVEKSSAEKQITLAVDLDGTLAQPYNHYNPDKIEPPRDGAREAMEWFKEQGYRIIIFTVRGDDDMVKDWLDEHEIPYDYVNENPDQPKGTSGKVIADYYIDDRAINAQQSWSEIVEELKERISGESEEEEDDDEEEYGLPEETVGKMKRMALTILITHGV